jgi:hypothetical protein
MGTDTIDWQLYRRKEFQNLDLKFQIMLFSKEDLTLGTFFTQNVRFYSIRLIQSFILVLNAEKASYSAPILGNKLSRTRTALLKDIVQGFS